MVKTKETEEKEDRQKAMEELRKFIGDRVEISILHQGDDVDVWPVNAVLKEVEPFINIRTERSVIPFVGADGTVIRRISWEGGSARPLYEFDCPLYKNPEAKTVAKLREMAFGKRIAEEIRKNDRVVETQHLLQEAINNLEEAFRCSRRQSSHRFFTISSFAMKDQIEIALKRLNKLFDLLKLKKES